MPVWRAFGFGFLVVALAACGGTAAGSAGGEARADAGGAGGAGGGTGGSTDGGDGAAGCVNAVEGASCSPGDQACPTGGDTCCDGFLACTGNTWTRTYPGCPCQQAGSPCGPEQCDGTQYCNLQQSGVDGGQSGIDGGQGSFSCMALPSECQAQPTCACVEQHGACASTAVQSCDDSTGHVLVVCTGA
jgi:hypothetical protein